MVALLLVLYLRWRTRLAFKRKAFAYHSNKSLKKSEKGISKPPLEVVFLHPSLTTGGAARLVVNACLSLQLNQKRWLVNVRIATSFHDKACAFPETVDGTLPVTSFRLP